MGGLLVVILLSPLVAWGLCMPVPAAIVHLCIVGFFELILVLGTKLRPLNRKLGDATMVDVELVLRRYYWFLRNPEAAVGLSRMCSAVALLSIPWLGILVWVLVALMALNYFVASNFAMRMNPINYLEHAAQRDPAAGVAAMLLKAVAHDLQDDGRIK